jgi:lactate permease
MAATQYLLATRGFWHLAGFGAGLAGLIAGMVIARGFQGDRSRIPEGAVEIRKVFLALAGYLVLILITVVVQLIEPVRAFLGQVVLRVPFPELQTGLGYTTPAEVGRVIHPFRHGGAILAYTSILSYLLYRRAGWYRPGAARKIVTGTMVRVLSSSLGIASMVAMAVIMAHAGMTDVLAQGLASGMSEIFPLVSPWIGALGAFMTGSNTNSNVVFALLQLRTAQLLGYSAPVILAAQTAGGAIGSVIAPAKVIVGASTAGMGGREGDILRRMLGYTIALILGLSGLIGIWTLTGG